MNFLAKLKVGQHYRKMLSTITQNYLAVFGLILGDRFQKKFSNGTNKLIVGSTFVGPS